jgi:Peptidase family M49
MRQLHIKLILAALSTGLALAANVRAAPAAPLPGVADLHTMAARFAPVDIRVDLTRMPANERRALTAIIRAAQIIDAIYLRQVAPHNETQLLTLLQDHTPLGQARLQYFLINKGSWSELDLNRPFLPGVGERPAQAGFYPADATRAEVETWLNTLAPAEHEAAAGFFTTIRRNPAGTFIAVPYSLEYQNELSEAAQYLRKAAELTRQPTLKAFLEKRAAAFTSNDYYDSDMAWMDLDATIEPTIGPYEVYADEWFNFKAAFEAFITVRNAAESAKLAHFSDQLQDIEDHLPIDSQYRNPKLGGYAPIRVVDVVYNSGDGNHATQTAAFNLPNDERVVAAKGSKRVLLKNFQQAKYQKVLLPIAQRVLSPADRKYVAFEPFFTHILMHELMHGLGPQAIQVDGRATTVRQELKELNGTLEEAKADVSGLWALQYLMDKGVLDKRQERAVYTTFLASTFRTLRFGLTESHARGMALQVNNLFDHGAIKIAPDGTFSLDLPKAKQATADLTTEIMTLQAHGDYGGAHELLAHMVVIRPPTRRMLDKLKDVPVDIAPNLVTAAELTAH